MQYAKEGLKYFGEQTLSLYNPAASSEVQPGTIRLNSVEKGFCLASKNIFNLEKIRSSRNR